MAVNRIVGFVSSIGAQMIVGGDIGRRGVLSPARDVGSDLFLTELKECGIPVSEREESL
jgi:hypothetical protein